jgi:hypothetical protein
MENRTELEQVIYDIKKDLKQTSINKVDEVNVMKAMLNDKDFRIGVYDKTAGYIGQRCPHEEAVNFAKDIISGCTGLDRKDSKTLAENYTFTKRDASFLLTNMRDFLTVYTSSGRKIGLIQTENTDASIYVKEIEAGKKIVPDKEHPGRSKEINTDSYVKMISVSKCPRYNNSALSDK